MELFHRKKGDAGEPLIILHGLYGSGDNWMSIAQVLSGKYQVYLIDQRNHGRSPHADDMSYDMLAEDINEFIDSHDLKNVNIIGHSMGGKAAMWFAAKHPDKIKKLVIVDVAPGTYDLSSPSVETHKKIIGALKSTDPSKVKNRKELNMQFAKMIDNLQLRMFLLKNIERKDDGTYRWRINIESIEQNIISIMSSIPDTNITINTPALFLKGEMSDYITEKDFPLIRKIFSKSEIITIPNAGHWLHARQPKLFIEKTLDFLKD